MDRWTGLLKVPVCPNNQACYKLAVSLRLCPESRSLNIDLILHSSVKCSFWRQLIHRQMVPMTNAIFFNGDRVRGTGDPTIEKLSDVQNIADILVSKFGGCTNAWVIEASTFNGPFAVYKDFIPSANRYGEPKGYNPARFPASTSTISLLSSCLEEVKNALSRRIEPLPAGLTSTSNHHPKTIILGFSKGGTVLNQLVTELSCCEPPQFGDQASQLLQDIEILPTTKEDLLNSITEIHYVDVGLNAPGAYITDHFVISRIADRIARGALDIGFFIHGTPRQWFDSRRGWVGDEKNTMVSLLRNETQRSGGRLQVHEKLYFADRPPDLQMHFQIIEELDSGVET